MHARDHERRAVTPRLPRFAARPRGPHHDRGARPRQLDALSRPPDPRSSPMRSIVGGFGAPLFLFLAGVAVPLSAGSKFRRTGDVARRVPRGRAARPRDLRPRLPVSGSVVGPRVVVAARGSCQSRHPQHHGPLDHGRGGDLGRASHARADASWRLPPRRWRSTLPTPIVRNASSLSSLPDPIEAYLRPVRGLSNFVLLSVGGFLFAGVHRRPRARFGADARARSTPPTSASRSSAPASRWPPTRCRFFPTLVPAVALLDDVAGVLLPPPRHHDRGASASRMPGSCGPAARRDGARSSNSAGPRSSSTGFTSRWSTA